MLSLHQMSACPFHKIIFQSCFAKCALSVQSGQECNSFFSAMEIMAFGSRRSFLINGIFSHARIGCPQEGQEEGGCIMDNFRGQR